MPPTTKKIWNEDLVRALNARHQQAWQQQRHAQFKWRDAAKTIEAVRKDIWLTSTGKIYNLPTQNDKKFSKTVYEECVRIIKGETPILPPGYAALNPAEQRVMEESTFLPYIERMERESGGYAILLAFHFSQRDSMTKEEICRIAQDYYKDEMTENYHAGRMYGSWKANETLARHDLITIHKTGARWTERGFRSNGKNTYSITNDGKKAIQQIFKKWPDIKNRTSSSTPTTSTWNIGAVNLAAIDPFYSPTGIQSVASIQNHQNNIVTHSASLTVEPNRPPKRKVEKSLEDEQELNKWIASSPIGSQKVFKVSKERRMYLHQLCDYLNNTNKGLALDHQSTNEGQRRHLYITLHSKGSAARKLNIGLPGAISSSQTSLKRSIDNISQSDSTFNMSSGNGNILGGQNGLIMKKPLSAKAAAAQAALARFETNKGLSTIKESPIIDLSHDYNVPVKQSPHAKPLTNRKRDRIKESPTIVMIEDSDDEKMPAQSPYNADEIHDYQPGDQFWMKSGEGPFEIIRVHITGHISFNHPTEGHKKLSVSMIQPHAKERASEVAPVIDLVDDESLGNNDRNTENMKSLTILIDDRERSRNHKPREMRIQLSKEIQSGTLHHVWPTEMKPGQVEESKLVLGDFAFEVTSPNLVPKRLPVIIERKRVADLIQRSVTGDHWKQLNRMRKNCKHAIMLIENDSRVASRFDPYGIQNYERKISHHTIENEEDLYRFMGRAIISSQKIKFVQSKDERATYRLIGAIGIMANAGEKDDLLSIAPIQTATIEQNRLSDRLTSGGIHRKIAKEIASQFGSVENLEEAFDKCNSLEAKRYLILPILRNLDENPGYPGNNEIWSKAVFDVFHSTEDARSNCRQQFKEIEETFGFVYCDAAIVLHALYANKSRNEAVSMAFDRTDVEQNIVHRTVTIQCSQSIQSCFEKPTEQSFYSLHIVPDKPQILPCVTMLTSMGRLKSNKLSFYILEGSKIVDDVCDYILNMKKEQSSFVEMTMTIAINIKSLCGREEIEPSSTCYISREDRRVLVVRGLNTALDKKSKSPGFQTETSILCDMVLSSLMLDHDFVVIQSLRKNISETAMILQQMALACFHYHLLTLSV